MLTPMVLTQERAEFHSEYQWKARPPRFAEIIGDDLFAGCLDCKAGDLPLGHAPATASQEIGRSKAG